MVRLIQLPLPVHMLHLLVLTTASVFFRFRCVESASKRQQTSSYQPHQPSYAQPGYSSPSPIRIAEPLHWEYLPVAVQLPTLDYSPLKSDDHYVSTYPPEFCRSTTARANLDCPCLLIGETCLPANSVCTRDPDGDGYCACAKGYVLLNSTCVTQQYYTQNVLRPFVISSPTITASCFLPANGVIGTLPKLTNEAVTFYNLTLLFSSPLGDTNKYITIDQTNGNILSVKPPPATVQNQTYQVTARSSSGTYSTLIFRVAYNCTPPTCSFENGNNIFVSCTLNTVGSTVATVLATGSVAPTAFTMTLISSTSILANTYYKIDSNLGLIQIVKQPHGGIFIERYNVTATNAVGQNCPSLLIQITTAADCT
ncbi:uncharacterized protein LOC129591296 [Paramacrobiotus metropolitanus]|uniref:uncharacterized protein LOC129591296 n=1 Tax=Paramacrobiotus metropolitanus TaxID=2943436 RepID=UPI0024463944|nr:uncharacterized protein LOC129591296 [Paramacrobiotus metropolitanus]